MSTENFVTQFDEFQQWTRQQSNSPAAWVEYKALEKKALAFDAILVAYGSTEHSTTEHKASAILDLVSEYLGYL